MNDEPENPSGGEETSSSDLLDQTSVVDESLAEVIETKTYEVGNNMIVINDGFRLELPKDYNMVRNEDPTIEVFENERVVHQAISLFPNADNMVQELMQEHFMSVHCTDMELNDQLMQLITHLTFQNNPKKKVAYRQYLIETVEEKRTVNRKCLSNDIVNKVIKTKKNTVIFIHESQQMFLQKEGVDFLNSLFTIRSTIDSFLNVLRTRNIYIVYFFHSNEKRSASSFDWFLPTPHFISPLQQSLSRHFNEKDVEKIHEKLILQHELGLWPHSDQQFVKEVKRVLLNGDLKLKIEELEKEFNHEELQGERADNLKMKFRLLEEKVLQKYVLLIGAFFNGVRLNEFQNLMEVLLEGSFRSDKITRKWEGKSDRIMRNCGLQISYGERGAVIKFEEERDLEFYFDAIKTKHPQFLQKHGAKLLTSNLFFVENTSKSLFDGMNRLFREITQIDPGNLIKSNLIDLIDQLNSKYTPIREKRKYALECREKKRTLDANMRKIERLKEEHWGEAVLVLIDQLEKGQFVKNNYESALDYMENMDLLVDGENVRVNKDELKGHLAKLKDEVDEQLRRAEDDLRVLEITWGQFVQRLSKLMNDLLTDSVLETEARAFLNFWQSSGQSTYLLLQIVERLSIEHGFDSLPTFQSMLLLPEKSVQVEAYQRIIRTATSDPTNLLEIHATLDSWRKEKYKRDTFLAEYAQLFTYHCMASQEESYERYLIFGHRLKKSLFPPEKYGEWPSSYPLFAVISYQSEKDQRAYLNRVIQNLFSKETKDAFRKYYYRNNPEERDLHKERELYEYLEYRISGFILHWFLLLTDGQPETQESKEGWKLWNLILEIASVSISHKQKTSMINCWKLRSRENRVVIGKIRDKKKSLHNRKQSQAPYVSSDKKLELLRSSFRNGCVVTQSASPRKRPYFFKH